VRVERQDEAGVVNGIDLGNAAEYPALDGVAEKPPWLNQKGAACTTKPSSGASLPYAPATSFGEVIDGVCIKCYPKLE
jgi:hypothetical protein